MFFNIANQTAKLKLNQENILIKSLNKSWLLSESSQLDNESEENARINSIYEEDKYQSELSNSYDNSSSFSSSYSKSKNAYGSSQSSYIASSWKNRFSKGHCFCGPHPSQHGLNMNDINYFDEKSLINKQFHNYKLHEFPHQSLWSQWIQTNQLQNMNNSLENISMSNLIMDPSFMFPIRTAESGNQNDSNQDDPYQTLREYYKNSFFPFSNDMLKDLVSQIDIYIQILIQTLLSTKDVNQQYQLYVLLYDFTRRKESILKPLKLPKFEISWIHSDKISNEENEPFKIHPQVSFYQTPILEVAFKIVKMIGR